jgi:hypothetical protein
MAHWPVQYILLSAYSTLTGRLGILSCSVHCCRSQYTDWPVWHTELLSVLLSALVYLLADLAH